MHMQTRERSRTGSGLAQFCCFSDQSCSSSICPPISLCYFTGCERLSLLRHTTSSRACLVTDTALHGLVVSASTERYSEGVIGLTRHHENSREFAFHRSKLVRGVQGCAWRSHRKQEVSSGNDCATTTMRQKSISSISTK